jgi:hypothetical protein
VRGYLGAQVVVADAWMAATLSPGSRSFSLSTFMKAGITASLRWRLRDESGAMDHGILVGVEEGEVDVVDGLDRGE